MEHQVPFKVYTFWNENGKPEVRRFGVDKSVVTSFSFLNSKLHELYPDLISKTYTVAWRDDEGDNVVISTDDEMVTAMTSLGSGLIRFFVNVKIPEKDEDSKGASNAAAGTSDGNLAPASPKAGDSQHGSKAKTGDDTAQSGISCDVCEWPIVGFRYKCVVCPDFDLCMACEAACNHREHCMLRLPMSEMSPSLIKAAMKRSRNFFKSVAHGDGSDKKQKGEKHEKKHDEWHSRKSEHRTRPSRKSWLETVANYMNEFSNLTGEFDVDIDIKTSEKRVKKMRDNYEKPKDERKEEPKRESQEAPMYEAPKQEEPKLEPMQQQQPYPEQPRPAGQMPQEAYQKQESGANNDAQQQTGASMPNMQPSMAELQKLLEMYMGEYYTYATPQFQLQTINGKSTLVPVTPASTSKTYVVGSKKPEPTAQGSTPVTPMSGFSSTSSDASMFPDKADDWTVINNEKDGAGIGDITAEVTFNLPEEFKERAKFGEGSNLYPPLNTATAVLNPKEPEIPKAQQPTVPPQAQTASQAQTATQAQPATQAPPSTQAQPATQAKTAAHAYTTTQGQARTAPKAPFQPQPPTTQPQPQPGTAENKAQPHMNTAGATRYHAKPHIDAAIRCMLSMGFTNEGGWLTQLLENKDGNIAAVVDMLNPVTPKNL